MNLEKENYNVIHFDNVTEAGVHYIKKAFQLTLLDLKLTEKDDFSGEKFWELIKKHNVDTPVIIISGEEDERIEKAKKIINPIAIFKKPLNIGNLIKKLKEIL